MVKPLVSESDRQELAWLIDLIERGKRGEAVEESPAKVLMRLYCIRGRIMRQHWINELEEEKARNEQMDCR